MALFIFINVADSKTNSKEIFLKRNTARFEGGDGGAT